MRRCPLAVLCTFALLGACGDTTEPAPTDRADAGDLVLDAAPIRDAGAPPRTQEGLPPEGRLDTVPGADRFEDPLDPASAGACYDGADNDDDELSEGVDCADANCATLSSCCVGSVRRACCEPRGETSFDPTTLSACEGGDPAPCVPGAVSFGAPRPVVDGGVRLGGDGQGDSGLLLQPAHDLRTEKLQLRAEVRQATECDATCLESVAIGVTAQDALGDEDLVEPAVALVVSGARRQARLVVRGREVARWADVGDSEWTLELRPDGEVWAAPGAEPLQRVAAYVPFGGAHVVAWGHSRNPSATDERAARLRSLRVSAELCDVPTAWRDRAPLRVERSLPIDTTGASAPTTLSVDGVPLLVYEWQGALYAARAPSDPSRYFVTTAAPDEALLRPNPGERVRDPELAARDGSLWLYYVVDGGGDPGLHRAPLLDDASRLDEASLVELDGVASAAPIGAPTVVPIDPPGRSERWAMVLRVGPELLAFASADGVHWDRVAAIDTDALAADEVRQPSLAVVNGGYQLFVSIRHGTRWRQALFASAELLYWRLVTDRALEGFGEEAETLGVRDLDARAESGALAVVYLGLDGARETLFRATHPVPLLASFGAP